MVIQLVVRGAAGGRTAAPSRVEWPSDGIEHERMRQHPGMALFRVTDDALHPVPTTTFALAELKERQDLQRLLRSRLDILGEGLLFVAEEYGAFAGSQRRIDLLAVDRTGQLVVIELKRTADGGHMDLQALRYAAMVSTMTWDQLVAVYAHQHDVDDDAARETLEQWTGAEPDEERQLSDRVRIILASADFSAEITSTVLWLTQQYRLDIACVRLVPYQLGAEKLIDVQQIIPLPEAVDFQIQQRRKEEEKAAALGERDYTKYDVVIAGASGQGLSKQTAIKTMVIGLCAAGVPGEAIRAATASKRWLAVQPAEGESVQSAFERQFPSRGTGYWFDLGMSDGQSCWVMPRLGGTKTETYLANLVATGAGIVEASWSESTPTSPVG